MDQLSTGMLVSVLMTELVQMVKASSHFKWFTMETEKANRVLGIVVAFLSGVGIHLQFDMATGQLIVTGLVPALLGHAALQWAQQQVYYRLLVAKGVKA
jgi:hypothetical protein